MQPTPLYMERKGACQLHGFAQGLRVSAGDPSPVFVGSGPEVVFRDCSGLSRETAGWEIAGECGASQ